MGNLDDMLPLSAHRQSFVYTGTKKSRLGEKFAYFEIA